MRREHVVVGGDDGQVRRLRAHQPLLVDLAAGGEGVRLVGAAEMPAPAAVPGGGVDARQIGGAAVPAARGDAGGDVEQTRMRLHVAAVRPRDGARNPPGGAAAGKRQSNSPDGAPQRSAGVFTGASHRSSNSRSSAQTLSEQPAMSSEVT